MEVPVPCYCPLDGWRHKETNGFTMHPQLAQRDQPLTVPCGQCIGCRLERSRQWAIRCMHERQMHDESCFITLTYDDDHLPYAGTLVLEDFQKFMKRLRKKVGPVRFYHCGEYGEETFRPHYHALIYGWMPNDKSLFSTSGDHPLYSSSVLSALWPYGHSTFGDVSFDTAAYTAGYIRKKLTGEQGVERYQYVDPDTGEIVPIKPPYSTMSRRPGIGMEWLRKHGTEAYTHDSVIMRGREMQPPKAYDRAFEHIDPALYETAKSRRLKRNAERTNHPTGRQLRAGEIIANKRNQMRSKI